MVTQNAWNSENPAQVARGGTGRATLTQYNILSGDGTNAINFIAPAATSGVPLISQGAASQPAFGTAVVAGGGTGLTSATAYAVLCGGTTSTNPLQSIAGVGTSGQVLTSNGAGALPTFQNATGEGIVVQQVRNFFTTKTQYTSIPAIPRDTSIPQNTEGSEVATISITPTSSTNYLWIQANFTGAVDNTTNNNLEIALFQDSNADALETQTYDLRSTSQEGCVYFYFSYLMEAGTTMSTTFAFRMGGQNLGTLTVNGVNNVALYGGTMGSVITVTEIEV